MMFTPPLSVGHESPATSASIPFIDLNKQNHIVASEWSGRAIDLIRRSSFIQGDEVAHFEKEFARFNDVRHCIGVGSGTDALYLALKACGIGSQHEVITVAHTFVATAEAIAMTGAKPVFVDVDRRCYTMDVNQVEAVITDRTRAIIPVHLYGQCAEMDTLRAIAGKYDLFLIEDACQAHGARYKRQRAGSMGHLGCFSFYPTKNLGAFGDGGAIVTNDPELNQRIRELADHGQSARYCHTRRGTNSRLDSLQASALRIKLRYLETWNQQRHQLAMHYNRLLKGVVQIPATSPDSTHVFHLYVIRTAQRALLQQYLREKGIATMIHYPTPIHMQLAFYDGTAAAGRPSLPTTEEIVEQILSLPLYPGMELSELQYVAGSINTFFREIS